MRHLRKGRKFGRERNQRKALMKSLASSFFMLGRIETTEAKAKELRPFVEKILTPLLSDSRAGLTRARTVEVGPLPLQEGAGPTSERSVKIRRLRELFSEKVTKKILERTKDLEGKSGGYTRVVKTGKRRGDGASMAIIEIVK